MDFGSTNDASFEVRVGFEFGEETGHGLEAKNH